MPNSKQSLINNSSNNIAIPHTNMLLSTQTRLF